MGQFLSILVWGSSCFGSTSGAVATPDLVQYEPGSSLISFPCMLNLRRPRTRRRAYGLGRQYSRAIGSFLSWRSKWLNRSSPPPLPTQSLTPPTPPIFGFGTEFGEGDGTKQKSVKRLFTEWGQGIQWMKVLVRNSTGKTIQRRGSGHSVKRRTLKIEFLCAHHLPKSRLLWVMTVKSTHFSETSGAFKSKTEKSRSHHRVDFWRNFSEALGVLK